MTLTQTQIVEVARLLNVWRGKYETDDEYRARVQHAYDQHMRHTAHARQQDDKQP